MKKYFENVLSHLGWRDLGVWFGKCCDRTYQISLCPISIYNLIQKPNHATQHKIGFLYQTIEMWIEDAPWWLAQNPHGRGEGLKLRSC